MLSSISLYRIVNLFFLYRKLKMFFKRVTSHMFTVHAFQPVTVTIRPFDLGHTRWEPTLRIQIQLITDTIAQS